MNTPIRFGVIGAIGRGAGHLRAIEIHRDAKLTALCDLKEEQVTERAKELEVLAFTSTEKMMDSGEVDAVIVGTPMPLHVPQSIMALERGIHVLAEVPAGVSIEECRDLVLAEKKSKGVFMMAENYCYMRPNVVVKAMAHAGLFGELYFGEGEYTHELKGLNEITKWRRKWQTGINGNTYPTHSLGPVLQWFGNQRVISVSCVGTGHHYRDPRGDQYENEDANFTSCRLSGGGLVNLRLDMISDRPHNCTYYSLQGTDGCYEATRGLGDAPKVWIRSHHEEKSWHPLEDFYDEYLPEHWKNPPEEAVKAGHGGGDYWIAQDFIDAILKESSPPIGIHEALDMTLPGLVSQISIQQGSTWVAVPDSRNW